MMSAMVTSGVASFSTKRASLTAKGQDADREEALSLGANAFLTKPYSPKKFLSHVDDLLDRP
jgi:DNA-binding response OmpR family regulator